MSFLDDEEDEYDINQYHQQPYYCNDLNNMVNNTLNINGLSLSSPSPPPPLSFHTLSFSNSSPCIGQHGFTKDTVDEAYSYLSSDKEDPDEIFLIKYSLCPENRKVYAKEYQELVDKYKHRYRTEVSLLIKGNNASLALRRVLARAFFENKLWYKETKDKNHKFNKIEFDYDLFDLKMPRLQWIPSHQSSSKKKSDDKYPYTGMIITIEINGHTFKDLSNFATYINLTQIELINGKLESLKGLDKLNNLEYLHVGYNRIYDISALENMVNLKSIDLEHNHITNGYDDKVTEFDDGIKNLTDIFSTLRPKNNDVKKKYSSTTADTTITGETLYIKLSHNFIASSRFMDKFKKNMSKIYGILIDIDVNDVIYGVKNITEYRFKERLTAFTNRKIVEANADPYEENGDKVYYEKFEQKEKDRDDEYRQEKQKEIENLKKENEEKQIIIKQEKRQKEGEENPRRNIGKEEKSDDE